MAMLLLTESTADLTDKLNQDLDAQGTPAGVPAGSPSSSEAGRSDWRRQQPAHGITNKNRRLAA